MNTNEIMDGCWKCPTCGFGLFKSIMFAKSGNIGADKSFLNEICPNDGTLMVPETYKMRCENLLKLCEQLLQEMNWLDQNCSFEVSNIVGAYTIGPFKRGELRQLAQAGLDADKNKNKS